ncbi:MAG: 4-hydroxy-tetrahydrodipicolinate synthase [Firmicutes bacterium]|jgi:4-hydroxy-tetrahydrodipicolinate synthase|nr:4-hydroxy-tetrahydrodipicolinate synthase [Bacillota bacterium]
MSIFKGSGVAIVTPFNDDNTINYPQYEKLIEWHIKEETAAIVVCGTTGETPTLSEEEKKALIKFTVEKVAKRVPVIAGTGTNNTEHALEMSKYAESVGVDGLLVVTPYYNKGTQKGLVKHFNYIADRVNVPIILYNVPGRTGVGMTANTIFELSKHKNIVAVKEASGSISLAVEIASLVDEDFYIYSGNDDMIVPILSVGGQGVISVIANILPKETNKLVMDYLNGDVKSSMETQLKMKPLADALFIEVNPIPVKAAMNHMGMEVGTLRLPLTEMEDHNKEVLFQEIKKYIG